MYVTRALDANYGYPILIDQTVTPNGANDDVDYLGAMAAHDAMEERASGHPGIVVQTYHVETDVIRRETAILADGTMRLTKGTW